MVRYMRIDKFLKNARLIKRRTIAKEACDQGKIKINDKLAKPGSVVKKGDIVSMDFVSKVINIEILDIKEHVKKEEASDLYKIIEG